MNMNKVPTAEELEDIKYDLAIAGREPDECYTAQRKATAEEIARLTDPNEGNYSAADAEGAEIIAEDDHGCILYRLPNATSDIKYAVEGATGDIVAGLDYCEAIEEWS